MPFLSGLLRPDIMNYSADLVRVKAIFWGKKCDTRGTAGRKVRRGKFSRVKDLELNFLLGGASLERDPDLDAPLLGGGPAVLAVRVMG